MATLWKGYASCLHGKVTALRCLCGRRLQFRGNPVADESDRSLGNEATLGGKANRRPAAEVSIGDERTLGDNRSGRDTVIDDIEVVDLEARYRVEGTLGQGGMGAVLLATDTRLDRKVAIKRILGEAAGNRMAVQRFLTEAKAIASLNHPNIVQIYDYGRAKDGPFLIMEYVDGGSLLDKCRESAMPLDRAIALACQLCDGLATVHDLGIVHRDIKPANVLLTKDGIPKIMDFGLAKAPASDHGQTMTGAVLGTPDFMPPEQRRDASLVDHRSDLWGLAATVYQMVTGRSPKIIRFDLVPAELTKVLGKALEDAKESRFQTAQELRHAFKSVGDDAKKAQLRATAIADELQEGQCRSCGKITSDLTKKFCRNSQCGASLRVACLKCDAHIPVWDGVCGECGGNQPSLLEARRTALQAKRAQAEALLANLSFDEAIGLANETAGETRIDLADLVDWAPRFVAAATAERDRRRSAAAERMQAAWKHAAAYDYPAAIHAIEAIPDSLRNSDALQLLADCRSRQDESIRLVEEIGECIKRKEIDGLLPRVERALALRGDRKDLAIIRQQLADRRDRQVAKARDAMQAGDAHAANAILSQVSQPDLDDNAQRLRTWLQQVMACENELAAAVQAAKLVGRLSVDTARHILELGERCLGLNPCNEKVQKVVHQCREVIPEGHLSQSLHAHIDYNSEIALALSDQGSFFVTNGKPENAEPFLKRALAIVSHLPHTGEVSSVNPHEQGTFCRNLAVCFENSGKHADAEPLYERTVMIREKTLGPEHRDTAVSLADLARCRERQGKYAEAESLFRRALEACEKALGTDDAYAASCHDFGQKTGSTHAVSSPMQKPTDATPAEGEASRQISSSPLLDRVAVGIEASDGGLRSVRCPSRDEAGPPLDDWSPTAGVSVSAVVAVDDDARPSVVGDTAAEIMRGGVSLVDGFMHLLGRKPPSAADSSRRYGDGLLTASANGEFLLTAKGRHFSPHQLAALTFGALHRGMRETTGAEGMVAVLAVPATYGSLSRASLMQAAKLAGIDAVRLLVMTQAEALACYWESMALDKHVINGISIVVHWDDNYCEATAFTANEGVVHILATHADPSLGAFRCKQRLVDLFVNEAGPGVVEERMDGLIRRWLWRLAEAVHKQLRWTSPAYVVVPPLPKATGGSEPRKACVTREQYESMCHDVLVGMRSLICKTLADAGIDVMPEQFNGGIYLTGDQAQVGSIIDGLFSGRPIGPRTSPEYAASWGAALLGAVLNGDLQDLLLLDALPRSIGIELEGGIAEKLVMQNTTLPTSRKRIFTPVDHQATTLAVRVCEGERPMFAENDLIGCFPVAMPLDCNRGTYFELTIDIDINSRITATVATCDHSTSVSRLLPQIEPLAEDASGFAFDDDDDGVFGDER
jgi:molecular chaperone DnaK (HSP70)/tetratricopeptide (TPR) repeat protein